MKPLRTVALTATMAATLITPIAVGASPAFADSWQQWGPWTQVGSGTISIKCRNYIDASRAGSKILLSGAVYCNKPASIAMTLAEIGSGSKSKYCTKVTQDHFCYISWRIKNRRGRQTFRASVTSDHITKDVKSVHIVFHA